MKILFGRFGQGALAILSLALLAPAQRADADAVFQGVAEANLTLTGLSGPPAANIIAVPFTASANAASTSVAEATSASAASGTTTFVPNTPAVGNSIVLTTSGSGTVPAPALGSANAIAIGNGGLTLVNTSSTTATLTFVFNYRYSLSASTDENLEFANAAASINLSALGPLGSIVSFSANPSVEAEDGSSQSVSSSTYPGFVSIPFTVVLTQFQSATITLSANTNGLALRAVPEPSSLALCGIFGASVLATLHRKRRPSLS